jgi:2-polyprenyl-6-methoxyphenol hydroxylase-like FAD-dependent oxidoreductase
MVAGRRGGVRRRKPVDVLVVGAGPAGLTTALQAHDHGATVRVVERRAQAFRPSRAMIMHPRTMESLRPLGVTDGLLERGDISPRAELHLGSKRVEAQLADVDLPDTAFPHLTMLRQMDVEEVLAAALVDRGVRVERGTELVDAGEGQDGFARAVLRAEKGSEEVTARFVAGCDGPASTVRGLAGIGWRGGAYREEVVLADVELEADLAPGILHVVAGREGLVFLFALGEGATWRLLATRPSHDRDVPFGQPGREVPLSDVQRLLDAAGLEATVSDMPWSAEVRLQHRLATAFGSGRLFLAGDAAHAHSPAAAQGMNSGMLDAVNLGWKLAFAATTEGDHTPLLESYERERRPVARQVLALTHAVFFAEASTNPLPAFLRARLVPLAAPAMPLMLRQRRLMAEVVRMLSQRWVRYRSSALSLEGSPGVSGWPRPGDRLPDQDVTYDGRWGRLHELTASPGVHVLLEGDAMDLDRRLLGPQVTVHRITSRPGTGVVAVRPDGHVGFRCGRSDPAQLGAWLDLVGAR